MALTAPIGGVEPGQPLFGPGQIVLVQRGAELLRTRQRVVAIEVFFAWSDTNLDQRTSADFTLALAMRCVRDRR